MCVLLWKMRTTQQFQTPPLLKSRLTATTPPIHYPSPTKMTPRVTRDKLHGIIDGLKQVKSWHEWSQKELIQVTQNLVFPVLNTINHEPGNHALASERKSLNTEHAFVKRETLVGTNDWSKSISAASEGTQTFSKEVPKKSRVLIYISGSIPRSITGNILHVTVWTRSAA